MSWERIRDGDGDGDSDGAWRARLSCPALVSTLERTGESRTKAIGRAARALTLLLAFRGKITRGAIPTTRDPDSSDDPWY